MEGECPRTVRGEWRGSGGGSALELLGESVLIRSNKVHDVVHIFTPIHNYLGIHLQLFVYLVAAADPTPAIHVSSW